MTLRARMSAGRLISFRPGRRSAALFTPHRLPRVPQTRSLTTMKSLTTADLNPAVLNVQYAVRGELAIKAEDLRSKLEQGHDLPFKRVINSNIGNPQQKGLDQAPLTFIRQVSFMPFYILSQACIDVRSRLWCTTLAMQSLPPSI